MSQLQVAAYNKAGLVLVKVPVIIEFVGKDPHQRKYLTVSGGLCLCCFGETALIPIC
jgi:hypothetical protein